MEASEPAGGANVRAATGVGLSCAAATEVADPAAPSWIRAGTIGEKEGRREDA